MCFIQFDTLDLCSRTILLAFFNTSVMFVPTKEQFTVQLPCMHTCFEGRDTRGINKTRTKALASPIPVHNTSSPKWAVLADIFLWEFITFLSIQRIQIIEWCFEEKAPYCKGFGQSSEHKRLYKALESTISKNVVKISIAKSGMLFTSITKGKSAVVEIGIEGVVIEF